MPIRTRRWNDPPEDGDGLRLLVTRYRPRGLPKAQETWDQWDKNLAPSIALHAAAYGKGDALQINWESYRQAYLREMVPQKSRIRALSLLVAAGQTITLLCSASCTRESRCHRSLLKQLIEQELQTPTSL